MALNKFNICMTLFAILWCVSCSFCANILAVIPSPSYAHHVRFKSLWTQILSEGHNLTLITTDPLKEKIPGLKQIDVSFVYQAWNGNISNIIGKFRSNKLSSYIDFTNMMNYNIECILSEPEVQKLIKKNTQSFDLVIAEHMYPVFFAFSKVYDCPLIALHSMDIPMPLYSYMGNPVNPSYTVDVFTDLDEEMNIFQRMENCLNYIVVYLFSELYYFPTEDDIIYRYFGKNFANVRSLQQKPALAFINVHPTLNDNRPVMPNMIPIGGGKRLEGTKTKLPYDINKFLDEAPKGAIYFSLGTNVKDENIAGKIQNDLIKTFTSLPYKILWKLKNSTFIKHPNILIKDWVPQEAVLAHPNIKLFVTQGGLQSLEEALFYEVPIIGMPFYADQLGNIRRAVKNGWARRLDYLKFSRQEFISTVQEVMVNKRRTIFFSNSKNLVHQEKLNYLQELQQIILEAANTFKNNREILTLSLTYRDNVRALSFAFKNQPSPSTKDLVRWIDYVIASKGELPISRNPSKDMPFYKYLFIDMILLCACLVYTIAKLSNIFSSYTRKKILKCD